MRIGDYQIDFLDTGSFKLDGGAMFGVVPKVLWERTNPADAKNRIDMALRVMLIRGRDRCILVDTGIGHKWNDTLIERYAIDHSRSTMAKAFDKVGVKLSDVTDVIVTHLHFDHVGGATSYDEKGRAVPTFPWAKIWVNEKNLTQFHAPSEKDRASFIEHTVKPVVEGQQLKVSKGNDEISAGVSLWITDGHTPGQQLVKVSSGGETLLFCGDTIPTTSHVPLPYVMAFDVEPMKTLEEKRVILTEAVKENWKLAFCHDPKHAVASVKEQDGRFSAFV